MPLPELDGFRRPRWRPTVPALWRDQDTIQFGDDVIVDRVTREHIAWLRTVDGTATSAELEAALTIPLDEARRLLRALHGAGGLDDAALMPSSARWGDLAHRESVAAEFEAIMAAQRDVHLAHEVFSARDRAGIAIEGVGTLRDEVAGALAASGLTEVARPERAALLVLADAHHPDVPAQPMPEPADVPHVHIGAHGARAVIGPLVVPGQTSCLRCAHLHRRDRDRAWPLLAVQWSQADIAPTPDGLLRRIAADTCAWLVRTWIDLPQRTDLWANCAFEITLPGALVHRESRPAHPLCGCLWSAA